MDSYGAHMFTARVRAEQDAVGMGARYAAGYETRLRGPLDAETRAFIESRTSFYMASLSETGWPYIQHRGGPTGFLKVLGDEQIGFGDYRGNKQFITKGNLAGTARVSLFLMDYPRRARLKLIGEARMLAADQAPALAQQLTQPDAPEAERICVIDLTAMDWNCPKYIVPRFTEAEMAALLRPRLSQMTTRIEELEARLDALDPDWRDQDDPR